MAKGFRSHRSVPCADLHFRPRERGCGLCGNPFTTTPLRRYFCERCYESDARREPSALCSNWSRRTNELL